MISLQDCREGSADQQVRILHLVRHGQASFHAEDYDQLSPLGAEQARALGVQLAARGVPIDALYSGPRRRQLDTARHLRDAARANGAQLPEPTQLDALDEVPFREILNANLQRTGVRPRDKREAVQLLQGALLAWAQGELPDAGCESFDAFAQRIDGALAVLTQHAPGHIVAVTSAGPIALALRHARAPGTATPSATMKIAASLGNASVTRFLHDGAGLTLQVANDVDHLSDALRSYV